LAKGIHFICLQNFYHLCGNEVRVINPVKAGNLASRHLDGRQRVRLHLSISHQVLHGALRSLLHSMLDILVKFDQMIRVST
jgi:hypothetical protein